MNDAEGTLGRDANDCQSSRFVASDGTDRFTSGVSQAALAASTPSDSLSFHPVR